MGRHGIGFTIMIRNKYIIWYTIPVIFVGGLLVDLWSHSDVLLPFCFITTIFSLLLALVGLIYHELRQFKIENKKVLYFIDFAASYTFAYPIACVVIALVGKVTGRDMRWIFDIFAEFGFYIFWLIQAVAIIVLGLRFFKLVK